MPSEHMQTAVVGGTGDKVRRSRCVWMTSDFTVLEMSAAFGNSVTGIGIAAPMGISQEWSRNAPGTAFDTSLEAGLTGDEIMVYTNGSIARAQCGGTIAAGAPVIANTDATIVTGTGLGANASAWIMGYAKEAGAAGDLIRIEVRIGLLL